MADDDVLNAGEGDEVDKDASPAKRAGGGSGFLFKILKFVAIGLGALIFIVTVVIITFNIMNGTGQKPSAVPQTESYNAVKPIYATYDGIDLINTQTDDPIPQSVAIKVILEYDNGDTATQTELIGRKNQMRDFIRGYFRRKRAAELAPEYENAIKNEIEEQLNTNMLDKARVRGVLFDTFNVYETQ